MWPPDDVVDSAAAALEAYEIQARDEQAVHGPDALEELDLHPILAAEFAQAGWGVLREQRYPSDLRRRPTLPPSTRGEDDPEPIAKDTERQRCDLVLTPRPGVVLADPVVMVRQSNARKKQAAGTLFEALAAPDPSAAGDAAAVPSASAATPTIPPEEAFWLEVKLVGQFCFEAGIPGPNRTYASQLVRGCCQDLAKLAKEPLIPSGNAAVLLIHFTADQQTAEHDQVILMHRCLDRGLIDAAPITRRISILDRIGNTACSVSLIRPLKP